ncbi:MAG: PAS domain-containing sensor histidine kinase [Rhodothermaceae bacterium]
MVYNKFQLNIFIRVTLIVLTSFALLFVYNNNFYYSFAVVLTLILLQTISLINYLNKMQRSLKSFLHQIKESEHNFSFHANSRENPFNELNYYYEQINKVIKTSRIEKENQYHYLQYVIEHIAIGLIAFDEDGNVELLNNSAKSVFQIGSIKNISSLDSIDGSISQLLFNLTSSEPKLKVIKIADEFLHLSFKASRFKLKNKDIKLISFQNIKPELDEKEVQSWQKLIRVLTHEISNSITPITTLTSTLAKFFKKDERPKKVEELNQYYIDETLYGLHLIEERGNGLIDFVNRYRNLSKNISPKIEKFQLSETINKVFKLFEPKFNQRNINFTISVFPENIILTADVNLVEQILINLLKNSIEAVSETEKPAISISSYIENERVIIQVIDNGKGIEENHIDNIFVPFYTTKENGSGIGLSLTKQIMRAHNGSVEVKSVQDKMTIFTLTF